MVLAKARRAPRFAKEGENRGDENAVGRAIVDAAVQLHLYEATLAEELKSRGFSVERQVSIPLIYKGVRFEQGFRIDLHVAKRVIVEVKSSASITDAHRKQLLTYLRLTDSRLGFLLNFGAARMKDGIVRLVNNLTE